jgi:acetolactate synthase-1/3 small subunit
MLVRAASRLARRAPLSQPTTLAVFTSGRSSSASSSSSSNSPAFLPRTNFFPHTTAAALFSTGVNKPPPFYPASEKDDTTEAVNNILYNLPVDEGEDNKYTLSVLVDNEAGVLSKVSGLLAGRGFNIDSLTVSTTDVRELSRMTITLKGPETQMDQARKQLEDLVQVWAVLDAGRNAINREMCMIKVSTLPPDSRPAMGNSLSYIPDYQDNMNAHFHKEAVIQTSKLFGGVVVDVGSDQMIIELVSWQRRIDAFIRTMKPFGVIEVARSGAITMPRVPVAGGADHDDDTPNQATDVSALPPS